MSYIDTGTLIEERNDLKQQILDDWNEKFEDNQLDDYDDIPLNSEIEEEEDFIFYWSDETEQINEIDELESEIGSEFEDGVTLTEADDFEDYCQEFCKDCGYISRDMPSLITNNIDWAGVAYDMQQDYSEVEFRGTTYFYR